MPALNEVPGVGRMAGGAQAAPSQDANLTARGSLKNAVVQSAAVGTTEYDWQGFCISSGMDHSCQFLCSELVTVTYEEQPGEIRQAVANLEEISTTCAVVLLEEKPSLGTAISLSIKGRDLFGVITSSVYSLTLGWFITVTLDMSSLWNREWFSPQHLFATCACSFEGATLAKARTLENTRNTEENVPVSFVVSEAG